MCLPSDALLQHLPSYLGFSYLGRGVSLHGCFSKAQPLLLTLDEGYLLTAALPDLLAPLGPPAPAQPINKYLKKKKKKVLTLQMWSKIQKHSGSGNARLMISEGRFALCFWHLLPIPPCLCLYSALKSVFTSN